MYRQQCAAVSQPGIRDRKIDHRGRFHTMGTLDHERGSIGSRQVAGVQICPFEVTSAVHLYASQIITPPPNRAQKAHNDVAVGMRRWPGTMIQEKWPETSAPARVGRAHTG